MVLVILLVFSGEESDADSFDSNTDGTEIAYNILTTLGDPGSDDIIIWTNPSSTPVTPRLKMPVFRKP